MLRFYLKAVPALAVMLAVFFVARYKLGLFSGLAVFTAASLAAGLWLLNETAPPVGYPQAVNSCPFNEPRWWPEYLPS